MLVIEFGFFLFFCAEVLNLFVYSNSLAKCCPWGFDQ